MRRNVRRVLMARPLRPVMRPLVRRIVSRRPRILVEHRRTPRVGAAGSGGDATAVKFSGVIDSGLEEADRLLLRREDAERVVRDWDREEPEQAGLLHVEVIELQTSAN